MSIEAAATYVDHAYFPCGPSLASLRISFADGDGVETALIGWEGAVEASSAKPACLRLRVLSYSMRAFSWVETARLEAAKHAH